MEILITYLIYIFLCVLGSKYKGKDVSTKIFSFRVSKTLKGLLATEILIGHVGQVVGSTYLIPFEKAMICSVGMFFCLSGYGLMDSYLVKPEYLKNFYKRYLSIGIPVILCAAFTFVIQGFHITFFEAVNWYIVELVVFYSLFYLILKVFGSKYLVGSLFFVTIICIFILYWGGVHKSWYVSGLCFVLGVGLKKYENEIIGFIMKHYIKSFVASGMLFGATMLYAFYPEHNFFDIAILRNISTLSFCVLVALVVWKMRIGNRFSDFIGQYSMGIYLYHIALMWPIWRLMKQLDFHFILVFIIILFICSLCLAKVMRELEAKIREWLERIGGEA